MPCSKITNIVIGIRQGEDVSNQVIKMFYENFCMFDELEYYQDFEWLKMQVAEIVLKNAKERSGFIYVAENGGEFVKVGRTKDVTKREKSLNTSGVIDNLTIYSSFPVLDAPWMEKQIHNALKRKCPKKKEFFLGHLKNITNDVENLIRHLEADFYEKILKLGYFTDPA